MTHRKHWDKVDAIRSATGARSTTLFGRRWVGRPATLPDRLLVDLGTGTGRDALWFAREAGPSRDRRRLLRRRREPRLPAQSTRHLSASFELVNLYDSRAVMALARAREESGVDLYARFTLHALDRPGRRTCSGWRPCRCAAEARCSSSSAPPATVGGRTPSASMLGTTASPGRRRPDRGSRWAGPAPGRRRRVRPVPGRGSLRVPHRGDLVSDAGSVPPLGELGEQLLPASGDHGLAHPQGPRTPRRAHRAPALGPAFDQVVDAAARATGSLLGTRTPSTPESIISRGPEGQSVSRPGHRRPSPRG